MINPTLTGKASHVLDLDRKGLGLGSGLLR
jgi:hypothetical protein